MRRILVAEDNDSNFILMGYLLKKHYEVIRAINGIDAVEKVEQGGIDMVLMDLKMPEMDGLQATRIIKEKYPDMPIIALTANAFSSDREQAFEAGCDEFLSKPVNSELCLETIAKLLK
ncbi:MAG: response regulator [Prevotella sp.]|uniref:response regulator n=1 Tax=Prevotella sp. P5-92 TaxID=2024222 RepID=UPI000B970B1A|nr:response regulator [Prevotella sp. P5-92]MCI7399893.1 response regulator [Prevotella sp.]MDD6820423.1 response regulator [Prevotella sp.]MDY4653503.1 response regulator [Prevotella sp.]OYP58599.1 two-component system response regulator [Prevotella sp. P5-92]